MDNGSNKMMLVHKGFFYRNVLPNLVNTITTHNIVKNMDIGELEAAVHRLVDRNPILAGKFAFGTKDKALYVDLSRPFEKFVHVLPTPEQIPSPAKHENNALQLMKYIQTNIEPHVPPSNKGAVEISKKLPLFEIHVMKLPDGYVYLAPRVSHILGDGKAYYMILEELNAILNHQKLPPPIVWESTGGVTFNISHQVASLSYWVALIGMVLVSAIFGFPKTSHLLLSKAKIEQKEKELAPDGSFLSTNDIVTAAICESACSDYDAVVHSINYRTRWPGIGERDAGNITRAVPFSTKECQDPNGNRRLVQHLKEHPNVDMPVFPCLRGRGYNQTNWASIQAVLDGTVFHAPLQGIVDANDIPLLIVYQPNDKEIGLMHKLTNVDPTKGLLKDILL